MAARIRKSPPYSRRDVCLWLAAGASAGVPWIAAADELAAANRALAQGDGKRALELYESLVRQGESIDAELGLIRAALRAGEFRKAMANANLTAGEHPESTEARALLAYLTDRGARTEQALAALRDLESAQPSDWAPVAAHSEILIDRVAPDQAVAMLEAWLAQPGGAERAQSRELTRLLRRARIARGDRAAASAAVNTAPTNSWVAAGFDALPVADADVVAAGNGVVVDDGQAVLTYAGALAGVKRVWVRNGLGHVRRAAIDSARTAATPLVRLRLDEPYQAAWSIGADEVGAPEGVQFCFVFSFGAPHSADPCYPAITPGLMVHADTGVGGLLQFSSRLGRGHNGAPLFDARGHLIGVSLASGDHVIAAQDVRKALGPGALALRIDRELRGDVPTAAPSSQPSQPLPPMPAIEELYERLAPAVVQVIGAA